MRSNLLEESILERMNLQLPDSQKIKYANFIIKNNSTKSALFKNVDKIIANITIE